MSSEQVLQRLHTLRRAFSWGASVRLEQVSQLGRVWRSCCRRCGGDTYYMLDRCLQLCVIALRIGLVQPATGIGQFGA